MTIGVLVAALGVGGLAGTAIADHPLAGHSYTGFTSEDPYNGFTPPVSFKVSDTGKHLRHFQYSGRCDGIGGFGGPGDPWINPYYVIKVGTIKVNSKGHFSVEGAKWSVDNDGVTKTTTSTVNGKFKTRRKAVGSIDFTQSQSGGHASCTVTFTAKTS
jgi:hypothetical protein